MDSRHKHGRLEEIADIMRFLISIGDMLKWMIIQVQPRSGHRIGTALDGGDYIDVLIDIGDLNITSIISGWCMTQCYGKALEVYLAVEDAFICIGIALIINDLAVGYICASNRELIRTISVGR